jgi:aldehyde:ferredoxin oxidoreductase
VRRIGEGLERQALERLDQCRAHPRHAAEHGPQAEPAPPGNGPRVEAVRVGHALEPPDAAAVTSRDQPEAAQRFLVAAQQVHQHVMDGPAVLRARATDLTLGQPRDHRQRGGTRVRHAAHGLTAPSREGGGRPGSHGSHRSFLSGGTPRTTARLRLPIIVPSHATPDRLGRNFRAAFTRTDEERSMRTYHDIQLADHTITTRELHGEDIVKAGRFLIARTLLDLGAATVDPLSPSNPLIFSAGPFAGTSFSNANRTSVGCKSPLTGGIKEANGGGSFGYALGQLKIAGFTLHGASPDWVVIHFKKDGTVDFDEATPYLGKGNFEAHDLLLKRYGKKVAIGLCGPVGEYQGLIAGIAFSDKDGRPARLAARGGVGAVMGSKKVKAVVVDLDKVPPFSEPKKVNAAIKDYSKLLLADGVVKNFYQPLGTMGMADVQNQMGGLPVNNFSLGQQVNISTGEKFKMGGSYIAELNTSRGGEQTHACMPGCVIQCSNVYVDAAGKEVVSPVEYETLGLLGTNCGLTDPDDLAQLNHVCNDLGVDTIETGAMLAVLMEAGLGRFGDPTFMAACLREIHDGTEKGRVWAQGTARVGEHYQVRRVPVIKKQAISAYDPRVVEATGIAMMATAQGADHTAGNLPRLKTREMDLGTMIEQSLVAQTNTAATDSLGLCIFGRSVTEPNIEFIVNAINAACGTSLTPDFFSGLGRETLRLEREFNRRAGFTAKDDELPEFFYTEALPPTNHVARFHGADVHDMYERLPA